MLSKLACPMHRRSTQLLALPTRGDTTKDLEILVLRHQLAVPRQQVSRPRLEPADQRQQREPPDRPDQPNHPQRQRDARSAGR